MEIQAFLTSYDPSDLPAGSIDPLGFERGYLFLADKILPGLTNVANRPRYFSMLCAGAYLGGNLFDQSPRKQYRERLERVLRLERFWALANVLAGLDAGGNDSELSGLRGVTYARAKAEDLTRRGNKKVNSDFKLLSRQVQYGAVGMYGAVADGMHFVERKTLTLSPDLGEKLAKGFIEETGLPGPVKKAVEDDGSVEVGALKDWGARAHMSGESGKVEANCFYDGLHLNPIRSRMTELLAEYPYLKDEPELKRLARIYKTLKGGEENADLREGILTIRRYEAAYQLALLGLERILWLCRQDPSGSTSHPALNADPVMDAVQQKLPKAVSRLVYALESGTTENFRKHLNRLDDVKVFLQEAASACGRGRALTEKIMQRHSEVQRGKFDRGRRKMPWVEYTSHGRIALTSTRVGGLSSEATKPSDIRPHFYRLGSADALYDASRRR